MSDLVHLGFEPLNNEVNGINRGIVGIKQIFYNIQWINSVTLKCIRLYFVV